MSDIFNLTESDLEEVMRALRERISQLQSGQKPTPFSPMASPAIPQQGGQQRSLFDSAADSYLDSWFPPKSPPPPAMPRITPIPGQAPTVTASPRMGPDGLPIPDPNVDTMNLNWGPWPPEQEKPQADKMLDEMFVPKRAAVAPVAPVAQEVSAPPVPTTTVEGKLEDVELQPVQRGPLGMTVRGVYPTAKQAVAGKKIENTIQANFDNTVRWIKSFLPTGAEIAEAAMKFPTSRGAALEPLMRGPIGAPVQGAVSTASGLVGFGASAVAMAGATVASVGRSIATAGRQPFDWTQVEKFGEMVNQALTYRPKDVRSQTQAEMIGSPFLVLTTVIDTPGEVLGNLFYPKDEAQREQFKAGMRVSSIIAMAGMGLAHRAAKPVSMTEMVVGSRRAAKLGEEAIYAPQGKTLATVDLKPFEKYRAWYESEIARMKNEHAAGKKVRGITQEIAEKKALQFGIDPETIRKAEAIPEKLAEADKEFNAPLETVPYIETPEGKVGPAGVKIPVTRVMTKDGTVIEVQPSSGLPPEPAPKAAPAPKRPTAVALQVETPEGTIGLAAVEGAKPKAGKKGAAPAPPAPVTFSRLEAHEIIRELDKEDPNALAYLARSFGIDPTKKTKRRLAQDIVPELMKVEKKIGAFQEVIDRAKTKAFVETPPAKPAAGAIPEVEWPEETFKAIEKKPAAPPPEAPKTKGLAAKMREEKVKMETRLTPAQKASFEVAAIDKGIETVEHLFAEGEITKAQRDAEIIRLGQERSALRPPTPVPTRAPEVKPAPGKDMVEVVNPMYGSREVMTRADAEKRLKELTSPEAMESEYEGGVDEAMEFRAEEEALRKALAAPPAKVKPAAPVVTPPPPAQAGKPRKAPGRPVAAKTPPTPAPTPTPAGKIAPKLTNEAIFKIRADAAEKFRKFQPEPKDASMRSEWQSRLDSFVEGQVRIQQKKSGQNVGFMGAGVLQDLYDKWQAGDKESGVLYKLGQRYNDFMAKVIENVPPGARAYEKRDAEQQAYVLRGAIDDQWAKITGGKGSVRTEFRQGAEEGRRIQEQIGFTEKRINDLQAEFDALTGQTKQEYLPTWRRVDPGEFEAAKKAGLEVSRPLTREEWRKLVENGEVDAWEVEVANETGRYGGYVRSVAREAEPAITPASAKIELGERGGRLSEIVDEQARLEAEAKNLRDQLGDFETELVLDPAGGVERKPIEPFVSEYEPAAAAPVPAKYRDLYTKEDWLNQIAKEMSESRDEEMKAMTGTRLLQQQKVNALYEVGNNWRRARSGVEKLTPDQIVAPLARHDVAMATKLADQLKKKDIKGFTQTMQAFRDAVSEVEAESGIPFRKPPYLPSTAEKPVPAKGPAAARLPWATEVVEERVGGKLVRRTRAGEKPRLVKPFEPPPEERGPAQFAEGVEEKKVEYQAQEKTSKRDLKKFRQPGVGGTGMFSETIKPFPQVFPDPPAEWSAGKRANFKYLERTTYEAIDKIFQEGFKSKMWGSKYEIPTREQLGGRGGAGGRASIEDLYESQAGDVWAKFFSADQDKPGFVQRMLSVVDIVKAHLDNAAKNPEAYKTRADMMEAIAKDLRNTEFAKRAFGYTGSKMTRGAIASPFREPMKVEPTTPLEEWQVGDAARSAIDRIRREGIEDEAKAGEIYQEELSRVAEREFGGEEGPLYRMALDLVGDKFLSDKFFKEFEATKPWPTKGVVSDAMDLSLKQQHTFGATLEKLRDKYGSANIPKDREILRLWAQDFYKFSKDKAKDWYPEAKRAWEKKVKEVELDRILEGKGIGEDIPEIYDSFFTRMFDALRTEAEKTPGEKLGEALEKRRQEKKGEGGQTVGFLGGGMIQDMYNTIKKFRDDLKETRQERLERTVREAGGREITDPEVRKRFYGGMLNERDPLRRRLYDNWQNFKSKLTESIRYLPERDPRFAQIRQDLLWIQKNNARSHNQSIATYRGDVLKRIDELPSRKARVKLMDTFMQKVFLDDLNEMLSGGAEFFPQGYSRESLVRDTADLRDFINNLDPAERTILESALEMRKATFQKLRDEIIAEGKKAGYDFTNMFKRENYYRHELLAYMDKQLRFGGRKLKPNTYSWGMKRRLEGYSGDINTLVPYVDTEIISRLIQERDRLRVRNKIEASADIYDTIAQQAHDQGLTMKEAFDHLIPEGYSVFYPDKNHLVWKAMTITERIAQKILNAEFDQLTMPEIESIREQMAVAKGGEGKGKMVIGPGRRPWIVPTELANAMDYFSRPIPESMFKPAIVAQNYWKAYKLQGPKRLLKFNIRNLTGDSEMHFIGNPSTFKQVAWAAQTLKKWYKEGPDSMSARDKMILTKWLDFGGLDVTFAGTETGGAHQLFQFADYLNKSAKGKEITIDLVKNGVKKYFRAAGRFSDMREGLLRLASFKDYLEQMERNAARERGYIPDNYGASYREVINALEDKWVKSWQLSNELSGAYDMIGTYGKTLRQGPIPFWSWKELTSRRYYRLLKNAVIDGQSAGQIARRFAPMAARKAGVMTAKSIAKFAVASQALALGSQLFNHIVPGIFGDPEAEHKLPQDVQSKPHLTFGYGHFFTQIGAQSDILDFMGLDIPHEMMWDMIRGYKTPKRLFEEWWHDKPWFNHVYQSMSPYMKMTADLAFQRKTYPSIFNQRGIRDPFEYLADNFDFGSEYRMLRKRPGAEKAGRYGAKFFDYQHEELETAYFDTISRINEFQRSRGEPVVGVQYGPKANNLYWMRRSLAEGNMENAEKFFKRWAAYAAQEIDTKGKSPEEVSKNMAQALRQSVMSMFPFHGMNIKQIKDLFQELNPREKRMVGRAMEFWMNVVAGPDMAKDIVAEEEATQKEEE